MPQSNIYLPKPKYRPQLCETFGNYEIKQHIITDEDDGTLKLFQHKDTIREYDYYIEVQFGPKHFSQ